MQQVYYFCPDETEKAEALFGVIRILRKLQVGVLDAAISYSHIDDVTIFLELPAD